MKTVLAICLSSFFLFVGNVLRAADKNHQCRKKPAFEKPVFETRAPEPKKRADSGMEKPLFEKPRFELEKMDKPQFVKPVKERPIFERGCLDSVSKREQDPEDKPFVRFATDSGKEWNKIQLNRRQFHLNPRHELKIRKPMVPK